MPYKIKILKLHLTVIAVLNLADESSHTKMLEKIQGTIPAEPLIQAPHPPAQPPVQAVPKSSHKVDEKVYLNFKNKAIMGHIASSNFYCECLLRTVTSYKSKTEVVTRVYLPEKSFNQAIGENDFMMISKYINASVRNNEIIVTTQKPIYDRKVSKSLFSRLSVYVPDE